VESIITPLCVCVPRGGEFSTSIREKGKRMYFYELEIIMNPFQEWWMMMMMMWSGEGTAFVTTGRHS